MLTRDKSIKLLLNHTQPTETLDSSTCLRVLPACGGAAAKAAGERDKEKTASYVKRQKEKEKQEKYKVYLCHRLIQLFEGNCSSVKIDLRGGV